MKNRQTDTARDTAKRFRRAMRRQAHAMRRAWINGQLQPV